MNKKNIFFPIIFLFFFCTFIVFVNLKRPRIFIVHSYATDLFWTKDINIGIKKVLKKYNHYSLRFFYMDTQRHSEKEKMEKTGNTAIEMIKKWKPDILLTIDDNAQEYVGKKFINDPKIKIVFSGLNTSPKKYGYDKANNATGVLQKMPLDPFKKLIIEMNPKKTINLAYITDSSITAEYLNQEIMNFNWDPIKISLSVCKTFDDWKIAVKKAEKNFDYIFLSVFYTIQKSKTDKTIVSSSEILEWTRKNSSIPYLSIIGEGGIISIADSSFAQGELPARIIIDILENNKNPKDIPIQTSNLFLVYIRERYFKKYNIQLPIIYENFAKAIETFQ